MYIYFFTCVLSVSLIRIRTPNGNHGSVRTRFLQGLQLANMLHPPCLKSHCSIQGEAVLSLVSLSTKGARAWPFLSNVGLPNRWYLLQNSLLCLLSFFFQLCIIVWGSFCVVFIPPLLSPHRCHISIMASSFCQLNSVFSPFIFHMRYLWVIEGSYLSQETPKHNKTPP